MGIWGYVIVGLVILAVAAIAEAYLRRHRPKRPLVDMRPDMPSARYNLGLGWDQEWRPKQLADVNQKDKDVVAELFAQDQEYRDAKEKARQDKAAQRSKTNSNLDGKNR